MATTNVRRVARVGTSNRIWLMTGSGDPSTTTGLPSDEGSVLINETGVWRKDDVDHTDWIQIVASSGAVPASSVTAGTFGAGDYVFPSDLTVTTALVVGTDPLPTAAAHVRSSTGFLWGDVGDAVWARLTRSSVTGSAATNVFAMTSNWTAAGAQDDATKPSWQVLLDTTNNVFRVQHAAAGGALASFFRLDSVGTPLFGSTTTTLSGSIGSGTNATQVAFALNGAAGAVRDLSWQSGSSARWIARANNAAETGSDAGSLWELMARSDTGASIDSPIAITRAANGNIALSRPLVWGSDNSRDIGASGANRPRTGYFGTSVVVGSIDSGSATDLLLQRNNVTQLTLGSLLATFAGAMTAAATTDSTSGSTGAIYTPGGLGVTKKIFCGTEIEIDGALNHDGTTAGFYGVTPTTRQVLATGAGATVDHVITALQTLGLVSQS